MDSTKRPSSYLDKRFDRLRDQDYSSLNQQNKSSRALKKLQSNRLAVIGIIFSLTIILSSIFAPLITKYDPQKVDLRSMLKPPSSWAYAVHELQKVQIQHPTNFMLLDLFDMLPSSFF